MSSNRRVLFYGNCQTAALAQILAPAFPNHEIIPCWKDDIDRGSFLQEIQKADVIITQPIKTGYRGKDYLSTEFILESSKDCVLILFPSLHFDFYYFDLVYRVNEKNEIIHEPSDYHYRTLIQYFQEGKTADEFLAEVCDNPDFEGAVPPDHLAETSLQELERREREMLRYAEARPCHIITASSFIRDQYKHDLLFYSMNHPTRPLLQYLARTIAAILSPEREMILDFETDPLRDNERGILYMGIQKYVCFDTGYHTPRLASRNIQDRRGIIEEYLDAYKKIK